MVFKPAVFLLTPERGLRHSPEEKAYLLQFENVLVEVIL